MFDCNYLIIFGRLKVRIELGAAPDLSILKILDARIESGVDFRYFIHWLLLFDVLQWSCFGLIDRRFQFESRKIAVFAANDVENSHGYLCIAMRDWAMRGIIKIIEKMTIWW